MRIDVLHVLPDLGVGGAERMATTLMRHARRYAAGVVCVGSEQHTALEELLRRGSIPLCFLGKPPGPRPRYALSLLRLVSRWRPRLLHTHRHVMPYVLPALAMHRTLPCVHTVHNDAAHELPPSTRMLQRVALRLGVVPVAVAQAVQTSVRAVYGWRSVPLIRNGIALPRHVSDEPRRIAMRRALGYAPHEVVILCVARLCAQKHHALLLDAFANVAATDARAQLLLVGDGPLRAELMTHARRRRVAHRVQFAGAHADVTGFLAAADVFALTSRWEGNPLSVMEAMAAALPVVATAVGGVPELVQSGRTGQLVGPDDAAGLAAALQRLTADASRRRAMGRAALDEARRRFDAQLMAHRYELLYDELLARRTAWQAAERCT